MVLSFKKIVPCIMICNFKLTKDLYPKKNIIWYHNWLIVFAEQICINNCSKEWNCALGRFMMQRKEAISWKAAGSHSLSPPQARPGDFVCCKG